MPRREVRRRGRPAKGVGIGRVTGLAELLELFLPLLKLVLRFELHFPCPQFRGVNGEYTGLRDRPATNPFRRKGFLVYWLRFRERNDEYSPASPQV